MLLKPNYFKKHFYSPEVDIQVHFGPVYLLQVSKNDDEERCFLKWFGFRISLYLMEFQIRAFLSFLFGSLLLTFEPNIFRVGGLDSNDIIKLYAQTFYSNTSYQLCELCTLCLLECYNWTVKPCKTLQVASGIYLSIKTTLYVVRLSK